MEINMEKIKKINRQSSLINLAIFIVAIVILNLISLNLFFRLDFSKGKIYSLSPASKVALRQLDDRMLVEAFFTREADLPPHLANLRRYTRDLLEEYRSYSRGRFRFEFIDDSRLREEAQNRGVPPVNVQVREHDRFEARQAFLGLVFHYDGRTEVIPLVQETRGLEYEITKVINKITAAGMQRVAFFSLEPEQNVDPRMRMFMQQQDRFQHAREAIRQHYQLVQVTLDEEIPADINTLVFTGAVDSLSVVQLFNIDQFIMSGRSVLFFQDRIDADLQSQQARPIESNIFSMLSHYGVNIRNNLLMDASSGNVTVPQRHVIFTINTQMQYPFFIVANEVNRRHSLVSQLSNLQYLFVSEIDDTNIPSDVHFTRLVMTSNQTGVAQGPHFNLGTHQFQDTRIWMNRMTERNRVITGLFEGRFTSYFADTGFNMLENFIPETHVGQIMIVPNMDFINSQVTGQNQNNLNLLMNAVDYLSNNEALITLRSREVINKPIKIERLIRTEGLEPAELMQKIDRTRTFVRFTNILLPGLVIILYGLIRYKLEINRRKRIKEIYE